MSTGNNLTDNGLKIWHLILSGFLILFGGIGWGMRLESVIAVHTSQIVELQKIEDTNKQDINSHLDKIEAKLDKIMLNKMGK